MIFGVCTLNERALEAFFQPIERWIDAAGRQVGDLAARTGIYPEILLIAVTEHPAGVLGRCPFLMLTPGQGVAKAAWMENQELASPRGDNLANPTPALHTVADVIFGR